MSRAKHIKYIVIHCQAGFGTLESMQRFWRVNLGWKSPGYHRWIDVDGNVAHLQSFEKVANGVKGYNNRSIHICYQGGVELVKGKYKAKDTRTEVQKEALLVEISNALNWLIDNQNPLHDVMILGHYHFSKDNNKNGVIDSWERIKECPSFDAYEEYAIFLDNKVINPNYRKLKLPCYR